MFTMFIVVEDGDEDNNNYEDKELSNLNVLTSM